MGFGGGADGGEEAVSAFGSVAWIGGGTNMGVGGGADGGEEAVSVAFIGTGGAPLGTKGCP